VGLYLLWKHTSWDQGLKWAVSGLITGALISTAVFAVLFATFSHNEGERDQIAAVETH
jgi:hypothetical protein